ncbi:MAG: hypothetical protein WA184_08100 [Stellaceae bacterium]
MPIMLSKTYDALISAGAPEDKARDAAEELADYESRLASIDNRLAAVEGKLTVMIWAIGVNAAATIAILGVLLRHA